MRVASGLAVIAILSACGAQQSTTTLADWSLDLEMATAGACECDSRECYDESGAQIAELTEAQPEFARSSRARSLVDGFAACAPATGELARSLSHARDVICSCRDEACILEFRRATLELHDQHDIRIEEPPTRALTSNEQELLEGVRECYANVSMSADSLASQFTSVAEELCGCASVDCVQASLAVHRERTSTALIISNLETHEDALRVAKNRFCECAGTALQRGVQFELGAFFQQIGFNIDVRGSLNLECE